MLLRRIVVLAIALGFVGYRGYLALALRRARRRGNSLRERELRARVTRITRWSLGIAVAVVVFLVLLVVLNARQ